jgi:hypothetical protein
LVGGTLTTSPTTGNPVLTGQQPLVVTVRLEKITEPTLALSVGADETSVALLGRFGSHAAPLQRPSGVHYRSKAALVLDGRPGSLELRQAFPAQSEGDEAVFGERFLALWRSQ